MSRFIDKLKQASQAIPRPMGFRSETAVTKPRMLVAASLGQIEAENLADLVAGADAGLLSIAKSGLAIKMLGKVVQAVPDIPWGCWLDNIDRQGIKQIEKAGGDFVLFPAAETPLALLEAEKLGKILAVEASLEGSLLKATNELPVDAVFATSHREEPFLSWQHLMLFRRLAELIAKPLLVPVPPDIATNELQALWEAGVDGVVVKVAPGQPARGLKKLRQMIDGLTPPAKRKQIKARALVPPLKEEAVPTTEEEEEE